MQLHSEDAGGYLLWASICGLLRGLVSSQNAVKSNMSRTVCITLSSVWKWSDWDLQILQCRATCNITCVVGVSPDQRDRDSVDILHVQHSGNLVYSSHSQLSRTDVDREKHSDEILSITEEGIVEQEVKENSERLQPKAYHIDKSPVGPLKESYTSLTGQTPQNIPVGHGIAEDSSVYKEKGERDIMHINHGIAEDSSVNKKKGDRDTMHINHGNETEKATFAFYSFRQRG